MLRRSEVQPSRESQVMCRLGRELACACLIPGRPVLRDASTAADARLGALACGRYAQVMSERSAYPSDLSDARWELIGPVLAAWRYERHGRALGFGRPPQHDLREIMNAILYVDRTGVQWR